jgi:hypothetical protein
MKLGEKGVTLSFNNGQKAVMCYTREAFKELQKRYVEYADLQQENTQLREALGKAREWFEYIKKQYTNDFTVFELQHDFLKPRERVIFNVSIDALKAIDEVVKE